MLTHVDQNTDVNIFTKNPLFDDLSYVQYVERKWISFDDIIINVDNNIGRAGGGVPTVQNQLKDAFSNRILTSECLPILEQIVPVYKNSTSKYVDYNLIDGYNRVEVLKQLRYTGYVFDIIKLGSPTVSYEDAKARIAMLSNAPRPKSDSRDIDIEHALKILVNNKVVKNDPIEISNWIVENCQVRRDRATRIANQVALDSGSDNSVTLWTPTMIRDEISDYGITSYGNYDLERQECGWTVKTGYERELFLSILRKLRLTKNTSYVTMHTKMPTGNQTVESLREEIVESFNELEKDFEYYSRWKNRNGEENCWRIEGALPQKKSERDKGVIVKLPKVV